MNHQRPKVVPERVVLVGRQVALGETGHNTVAFGGFARKTVGLG